MQTIEQLSAEIAMYESYVAKWTRNLEDVNSVSTDTLEVFIQTPSTWIQISRQAVLDELQKDLTAYQTRLGQLKAMRETLNEQLSQASGVPNVKPAVG